MSAIQRRTCWLAGPIQVLRKVSLLAFACAARRCCSALRACPRTRAAGSDPQFLRRGGAGCGRRVLPQPPHPTALFAVGAARPRRGTDCFSASWSGPRAFAFVLPLLPLLSCMLRRPSWWTSSSCPRRPLRWILSACPALMSLAACCRRLIPCHATFWSCGRRLGSCGRRLGSREDAVSCCLLRPGPQVRNVRRTNAALRSRLVEVWRRVASLENREGAFLWELGCLRVA